MVITYYIYMTNTTWTIRKTIQYDDGLHKT